MQEFERRVRRLEEGLDRVSARTERIGLGKRAGGGGGLAGGAKSADTKSALDAILLEGEFGFTTGTTKRGYWKVDGVTRCVTHAELEEE